ncbi:13044_t:CDS:2, partial [Acaulospora colombiana]
YVNNTVLAYPERIEISKFNPQGGMFYSELVGSGEVEWHFYNAPDAQGKLNLANRGNVSLSGFGDGAYRRPFHTIDGGYGIIMADINNSMQLESSSWVLNIADAAYTYMEPLFSGGKYSSHSIIGQRLNAPEDSSSVVNGYLFDGQGQNVTWGLPSLNAESTAQIYGVFQNNTAVVAVRDYATSSAWDLISIELSNFANEDHGYNNPNVLSTSPSINGTISVGTNLISIQFDIPILPSVNN